MNQPVLQSSAILQSMYPLMEKSQIIGRKVADWNRSWNLAECWHDRHIQVRPTFVPQEAVADYSVTAPGGVDGLAYTLGALTNLSGNTGGSAQDGTSDLWICPPDPQNDSAYNGIDQGSMANAAAPSSFAAGMYNKTKKAGIGVDNIFMAVEHLPNPDGTIVPVAWDFYCDTNISIELSFDYNGYQPNAITQSIIVPGYPSAAGTKAPGYVSLMPNKYQAVCNNARAVYAPLIGNRNANFRTVIPGTSGLASTFGSIDSHNMARHERMTNGDT